MRSFPLLMLCSTACEDPGLSSGAGSEITWLDADGDQVDGVVYLGDRLSYVDDHGFFWPLDPLASGEAAFVPALLDDSDLWDDLALILVFAEADCSGDPWIAHPPAPPGVVTIAASTLTTPDVPDELEGATFVIRDTAMYGRLDVAYDWVEGECVRSGYVGQVAYHDLAEVFPPPVWWTAPLRPELD